MENWKWKSSNLQLIFLKLSGRIIHHQGLIFDGNTISILSAIATLVGWFGKQYLIKKLHNPRTLYEMDYLSYIAQYWVVWHKWTMLKAESSTINIQLEKSWCITEIFFYNYSSLKHQGLKYAKNWCQSLQNDFWTSEQFLVLAGLRGRLKIVEGLTEARVIFPSLWCYN